MAESAIELAVVPDTLVPSGATAHERGRATAAALLLSDQLLPLGIGAASTFVHARSPLEKTKEISLAPLTNDG